MKSTTLLLLGLGLFSTAHASWFSSSSPPYKSWSASQLSAWLEERGIPVPDHNQVELETLVEQHWNRASPWPYEHYATAQKAFADISQPAFDKWDESHLREFLLKQGIVSPKSTKDELVLLANAQYKAYTDASSAYGTPTSGAFHQATESVSSMASRVTEGVARTLDDTKDYVYSTWDDNMIRAYLESKGVQVREQAKSTRNDLLGLMRDAYAKVTQPVWEAWSDSYLHDWLVSHHIISPKPPSPYSREYLLQKMREYYYDSNDKVYSTWSESQLKDWLVRNGYVKSDAQISRDKLYKLVEDNYLSAKTTTYDAWSDSAIRHWLVEHKYIDDRTAAQKKRDELIALMKDKYHGATAAPYLAWPDARLRAYLRSHNMSEADLPTGRPGLLQEVRIRWVQTQTMWNKVGEIVSNMEGTVEDRLSRLWGLMRGTYETGKQKGEQAKETAYGTYEEGKRKTGETYEQGKRKVGDTYEGVGQKYEEMKGAAGEKYEQAKGAAGEKYEQATGTAKHKYHKTAGMAGEQYEHAKGKAGQKMGEAREEAGRKYTGAEKAYEAGKERAYDRGQQAKVQAGEKMETAGDNLKSAGHKVKEEL